MWMMKALNTNNDSFSPIVKPSSPVMAESDDVVPMTALDSVFLVLKQLLYTVPQTAIS